MNKQLNLPEEFRQYYSPTLCRVYRVQQSFKSGKYGIFAIKTADAGSLAHAAGHKPSWGKQKFDDPREAQMHLDVYARTHRLNRHEKTLDY